MFRLRQAETGARRVVARQPCEQFFRLPGERLRCIRQLCDENGDGRLLAGARQRRGGLEANAGIAIGHQPRDGTTILQRTRPALNVSCCRAPDRELVRQRRGDRLVRFAVAQAGRAQGREQCLFDGILVIARQVSEQNRCRADGFAVTQQTGSVRHYGRRVLDVFQTLPRPTGDFRIRVGEGVLQKSNSGPAGIDEVMAGLFARLEVVIAEFAHGRRQPVEIGLRQSARLEVRQQTGTVRGDARFLEFVLGVDHFRVRLSRPTTEERQQRDTESNDSPVGHDTILHTGQTANQAFGRAIQASRAARATASGRDAPSAVASSRVAPFGPSARETRHRHLPALRRVTRS